MYVICFPCVVFSLQELLGGVMDPMSPSLLIRAPSGFTHPIAASQKHMQQGFQLQPPPATKHSRSYTFVQLKSKFEILPPSL